MPVKNALAWQRKEKTTHEDNRHADVTFVVLKVKQDP
jgi:hypothetical protein